LGRGILESFQARIKPCGENGQAIDAAARSYRLGACIGFVKGKTPDGQVVEIEAEYENEVGVV